MYVTIDIDVLDPAHAIWDRHGRCWRQYIKKSYLHPFMRLQI
ncbi:hypothetical protein ACEQPO_27760 [Bacillus sp. SL00103]